MRAWKLKHASGEGIRAGWDIETVSWTRFILGSIYYKESKKYFRTRDPMQYARVLISTVDTGYSWYGGRYEDLWILSLLEREKIEYRVSKIFYVQSRIASCALETEFGAIVLKDPTLLIPATLKEASSILESPKLPPPIALGTMPKNETEWELLGIYCDRDAFDAIEVWDEMHLFAEVNGLAMGRTLASSSLLNAEKYGYPTSQYDDPYIAKIVKDAAYGGRVGPFIASAEKVYTYDLVGAYASAMNRAVFPLGPPILEPDIWEYFEEFCRGEGRDGVISCTVSVPDCYLPPLPVRFRGSLFFPWGEFSGTWVFSELQYAIENCGVSVLDVDYGVRFPSEGTPFGNMLELLDAIRNEVGRKTFRGKWIKRYGNSGYGATIQRLEQEDIFHKLDINNEKLICDPEIDCEGNCTGECYRKCCTWECTGFCGSVEELAPNWYTRRRVYVPPRANYQIGAIIAAKIRVEWHRKASENLDYLAYGDTDCVHLTREIDDSRGFGSWEFERPLLFPAYYASKSYIGWEPGEGWFIRQKGIPIKTAREFFDFWSGKAVDLSRGVYSLKMALRRRTDLFTRKHLTRRTKGAPDIRLGNRWYDPEQNDTRPPHITEIANLWKIGKHEE